MSVPLLYPLLYPPYPCWILPRDTGTKVIGSRHNSSTLLLCQQQSKWRLKKYHDGLSWQRHTLVLRDRPPSQTTPTTLTTLWFTMKHIRVHPMKYVQYITQNMSIILLYFVYIYTILYYIILCYVMLRYITLYYILWCGGGVKVGFIHGICLHTQSLGLLRW